MRSHFLVGLCAVSGATGLLASPGSAGSSLALDDATDPAYDDGWQAGDNGGFGFSAWNMDGTYASTIQHDMDDGTSPYNQLGRAWTLFNPLGPEPSGMGGGGDVSRAGRGFAPLGTGQNLRVVIDNPTQRRFFRGYHVRFNSGAGTSATPGCHARPGRRPPTSSSSGSSSTSRTAPGTPAGPPRSSTPTPTRSCSWISR